MRKIANKHNFKHNLHLKEVKEQTKLRVRRRKEIINIRVGGKKCVRDQKNNRKINTKLVFLKLSRVLSKRENSNK